ncbi:MAG: UDP-N-acetylmuramoyl-L-alanyl-D-glutamate--2,6-diaminopimelate ligase [Candidatus Buchananbacteria bacterium]
MKAFVKKLLPKFLLSYYHKFLAVAANFYYGRPSEKLIVIGITGTTGKSTTVAMLDFVLTQAGYKVGYTSTIAFKYPGYYELNKKKMTMLGRFQLQKILRQMVSAGCQYAIVETTSQGIEQWRHWGVHYDLAVLTNLYPEHLEAHGGFDNYKAAKLKLFARLSQLAPKIIAGQKIKRQIVVNLDDQHATEFLAWPVEQKIGYTTKANHNISGVKEIKAELFSDKFYIQQVEFSLPMPGQPNLLNAFAAVNIGLALGLSLEPMAKALKEFQGVPGRLEEIKVGQSFRVIVDYAFEPQALTNLYQTVKIWPHQKIISVLGSTGGGRDIWRRAVLGELAGKNAEVVIVTNEDPYDEDPQQIIDQVATGAVKAGKILEQNLFKILDRRQGIAKAISLAQAGDIVLITGKGCEPVMAVANGKLIPWDDREVVREEIGRLVN